jgi:hypothetical protein
MVVGLLRYIDRDVCRHSAPDTKVRTYSAWQGPELLMLFTDVVVDNWAVQPPHRHRREEKTP